MSFTKPAGLAACERESVFTDVSRTVAARSMKVKQVLVVFPSSQVRRILEEYSQGRYEYHWFTDLDAPTAFDMGGTNDPSITMSFNPEEYIQRAVDYIREKEIDAVVYFNDYAGLIASIICKKTGLRGPSVQSQFLCIHKYYSRIVEPSKLWFDAIELDKDDWHSRIRYPCYIKPPCMFRTMCQFAVKNEQEMESALKVCRRELPPWNALFKPIFEKYVNTNKFPLALKDTVVVEELVQDGTQHTVEGWVDENGEARIWLTSDEGYFSKPERTVEGYFMPSQVPKSSIRAMEEEAIRTVQNHGLRNTFFDVELWCRNGGKRVDVTEINNRIVFAYHELYYYVYNTSNFYGALHLACGEFDELSRMHPASKCRDEPMVGGLFYVHVHTKEEQNASEIINFQQAKEIQQQALKMSLAPTSSKELNTSCFSSGSDSGIDFDQSDDVGTLAEVVGCLGPGVDLNVTEEYVIRPLGSAGLLVAAFNIFKPTFRQVLGKADEVRTKLFKNVKVLPYEREGEYYRQALANGY